MTTPIFPTLAGRGWDIVRRSMWATDVQVAVSGKETRASLWSYPQYQWELVFDALHATAARPEFQSLFGFFNGRQGRFGTFLYRDEDDNQVAGQPVGEGDGVTAAFQLVRTFGGYVEPMWAPNQVTAVRIDGVAVPPDQWSVARWGSDTPGKLILAAPPAAGSIVEADFSYWFPCRFQEDTLDFAKFMHACWKADKVAFQSEK